VASHSETQEKLYEAITNGVDEAVKYDGMRRAAMLRELALAFRYAAGGQQPGGVHVEGK
jgi:hypothetical protein